LSVQKQKRGASSEINYSVFNCKIFHRETPDLVLLDIALPDVLGYELAKLIKKEKPHIKIIAQTAYASASGRQKVLLSGCHEYISKPLKRDDLLSKISKLLNE
jgi:CheY-like chemotaxis protein